MALPPGTRLGVYEVAAPIGEGGMGQVYRATDTKLKRQVAIKILPPALAADPDRLARFQREAEVLASLNHPHIAAIYGVEESGAATGGGEGALLALVMELVEGEDLSQRIARGAIPLDEALGIAKQIADALEAAHDQGIIHRDLKPANIKVRDDGTVKVLDFGLAKMLAPVSGSTAAHLSQSPTITNPAAMTAAGVILGTAAYMSPEQAKGRAADKRSDIWAFGCVLYEMLTGTRAFGGEDLSDTLAAVLRAEPDWAALPATTPASVRKLLRRCLDRDRKRRLDSAAAARLDIEDASGGAAEAVAVSSAPLVPRRALWRRAFPVASAAILTAGVASGISWWLWPAPSPPPPIARFSLTLPEGRQFTDTNNHLIALSPDGTRIAYVADRRVWLRSLGDLEARAIAGDGVAALGTPVFAPDGQSIAFFTGDGSVKRVGITGGAAVTISSGLTATAPYGASWTTDGLFFGQNPGGILRVSPTGGTPEVVVRAQDGEVAAHPWPLPGGQVILFTLATGGRPEVWTQAQIVGQSLTSGERRVVIDGGSDARYLPTGHLAYAVGGVLYAVRFDPARLVMRGGATPIVEGVRRGFTTGVAQFGVSNTGSLAYVPGPVQLSSGRFDLALVDRTGQVVPLKLPPGAYVAPRVSPDGSRVAFQVDEGTQASIWVYELAGTSQPRRLTLSGRSRAPTWSADGQRLTFQSDRDGDAGIFWQLADGTGPVERLTTPEPGTAHIPDAWSPNGETLLFETLKDGRYSLWRLSRRDKTVARLGQFEHTEAIDAVFSPDGRWVAYDGPDARGSDIFVEPFPPSGARYQVTRPRSGLTGRNPFWWRDGQALKLAYAVGGNRFEAVAVTTQPSFKWDAAVPVPRGPLSGLGPGVRRNHDPAPGTRIIGVVDASDATGAGAAVAPAIQVVLQWFDELKRLVPTN